MTEDTEYSQVYRVFGVIEEEETRRPLAGLVVRAFDRDLIFDDRLGFTITDGDGRFEIRYASEQFRDLWESQPDIYLRVFDADGSRMLHETRDAIRWNASADEEYRILVPYRALDPTRSEP
jgi:carotenoid cleavage dioxygenase